MAELKAHRNADLFESPILEVKDFGVSFAERIILSAVDLEIYPKQLMCLIGPTGVGKSTLLRSLAGFNNTNPNFHSWGQVRYLGQEPAEEAPRPHLVQQNPRLLMSDLLQNLMYNLPERHTLTLSQQRDLAARMLEEANQPQLADKLNEPVIQLSLVQQRLVMIIRACNTRPRLLCLDEPCSGLATGEEDILLNYIDLQRSRRAVLICLYNRKHVLRLGGKTALLASGCIQELSETKTFFSNPRSAAANQYVATGSCALPSPDASVDELAQGVVPPSIPAAAREYISDSFGPRGFLWLQNGFLAGTAMPGVFFDTEYDLKALQRVGITHLISLMETQPPVELNQTYGITTLWSPIPDMGAPELSQAVELCQYIKEKIDLNCAVAVHCRAGMGRTGTILAAYLIWLGKDAFSALEHVRNIEPGWVQSQQQIDFLEAFEQQNQSENSIQYT
ncbi:MAG: ATP-binding cassette domain-containing protein [Reinekea sp.]|jgi:atypical dual specificity phosphatase